MKMTRRQKVNQQRAVKVAAWYTLIVSVGAILVSFLFSEAAIDFLVTGALFAPIAWLAWHNTKGGK